MPATTKITPRAVRSSLQRTLPRRGTTPCGVVAAQNITIIRTSTRYKCKNQEEPVAGTTKTEKTTETLLFLRAKPSAMSDVQREDRSSKTCRVKNTLLRIMCKGKDLNYQHTSHLPNILHDELALGYRLLKHQTLSFSLGIEYLHLGIFPPLSYETNVRCNDENKSGSAKQNERQLWVMSRNRESKPMKAGVFEGVASNAALSHHSVYTWCICHMVHMSCI